MLLLPVEHALDLAGRERLLGFISDAQDQVAASVDAHGGAGERLTPRSTRHSGPGPKVSPEVGSKSCCAAGFHCD